MTDKKTAPMKSIEPFIFQTLLLNGQMYIYSKTPPPPPPPIQETPDAMKERENMVVIRMVQYRHGMDIFCVPKDPTKLPAYKMFLPNNAIFSVQTVCMTDTLMHELIPEALQMSIADLYGVDEETIRSEVIEEIADHVREKHPELADDIVKTFASDEDEDSPPKAAANGSALASAGAS